jgi:hypothetical protein
VLRRERIIYTSDRLLLADFVEEVGELAVSERTGIRRA